MTGSSNCVKLRISDRLSPERRSSKELRRRKHLKGRLQRSWKYYLKFKSIKPSSSRCYWRKKNGRVSRLMGALTDNEWSSRDLAVSIFWGIARLNGNTLSQTSRSGLSYLTNAVQIMCTFANDSYMITPIRVVGLAKFPVDC